MNELLSNLVIPYQINNCEDVHCTDPEHVALTDELVVNVLESVDVAARNTLCHTGAGSDKKNRKSIPGWSQLVQPYKEKSLFWHQVWLSAGRPLNNELHKVMKKCSKYLPLSPKKMQEE